MTLIHVHYNPDTKTWIVMTAEDVGDPIEWAPVFEDANFAPAAAYAMVLRRAYDEREAMAIAGVVDCKGGAT